jgi:hypothetical protein
MSGVLLAFASGGRPPEGGTSAMLRTFALRTRTVKPGACPHPYAEMQHIDGKTVHVA